MVWVFLLVCLLGEGCFCLVFGFNYGRIEKKDEKQIPPSSSFLGKADRFLILNALQQQHIHQPADFLQLFMPAFARGAHILIYQMPWGSNVLHSHSFKLWGSLEQPKIDPIFLRNHKINPSLPLRNGLDKTWEIPHTFVALAQISCLFCCSFMPDIAVKCSGNLPLKNSHMYFRLHRNTKVLSCPRRFSTLRTGTRFEGKIGPQSAKHPGF